MKRKGIYSGNLLSWLYERIRPSDLMSAERSSIEGERGLLVGTIFRDDSEKYIREQTLARLLTDWDRIAGPLARHSQPEKVTATHLHIRAEKSVYAQEISLYQSVIVEQCNKVASVRINSLIIKTGPIQWKKTPERETSSAGRKKSEKMTGENSGAAEKEREAEMSADTSAEFLSALERLKDETLS